MKGGRETEKVKRKMGNLWRRKRKEERWRKKKQEKIKTREEKEERGRRS